MNTLELKNVSKKYKDFELSNVSFNIPEGKILGLVGGNGAGKSTTIKLILDMVKRTSGEIYIFGKENRDSFPLLKNDIGVVFDDIGIPRDTSPLQTNNIMKNIFSAWDEEKYFKYLEIFSLPKNKKVKEFSRGMRMKLGIAIALSHNAKLLLLDEATSGLDPVIRDEVLDILLEFVKEPGKAILISSHIISDLDKVCDSVVFLHNGRVVFFEDIETINNNYSFILCREDVFKNIDKLHIIGSKNTKWGIEAIVEKEHVPKGAEVRPVDIEQLFLFMSREEANK
jgi:ABC-2 type transport system ATP-binding protein